MGVYLSPENYASDHKLIDKMRIEIFKSCTKKLQATPKKMALLAGVPLHASNDLNRVQKCITTRYGFKIEDVCLMIEKPGRNLNSPTAKNIGNKLMELARKSNKGDLILHYFVGHGGRHQDKSGTKSTKHVEYLAAAEGTILAGSTLKKVAEAIPEGVTFVLIVESCHSGGLIDGLTEVVGRSVNKWKTQTHKKIKEDKKKRSMFKGSIIMISSCQSFETARYEDVDGVLFSNFTHHVMNAVEKTKVDYSYTKLVEEANRRLEVQYRKPPKEKMKKNQRQRTEKISQHTGLYCDHELAEKLFLGGKSQTGTSLADSFLGGRSTNF